MPHINLLFPFVLRSEFDGIFRFAFKFFFFFYVAPLFFVGIHSLIEILADAAQSL